MVPYKPLFDQKCGKYRRFSSLQVFNSRLSYLYVFSQLAKDGCETDIFYKISLSLSLFKKLFVFNEKRGRVKDLSNNGHLYN